MDVLLKYEHLMHREADRYAGGQTSDTSAAAKTLSGLSKIREPAQELYGKAAHTQSLRKDLDRDIRDMGEGKAWAAKAESARLGREAAIHESSADKLVRAPCPTTRSSAGRTSRARSWSRRRPSKTCATK